MGEMENRMMSLATLCICAYFLLCNKIRSKRLISGSKSERLNPSTGRAPALPAVLDGKLTLFLGHQKAVIFSKALLAKTPFSWFLCVTTIVSILFDCKKEVSMGEMENRMTFLAILCIFTYFLLRNKEVSMGLISGSRSERLAWSRGRANTLPAVLDGKLTLSSGNKITVFE